MSIRLSRIVQAVDGRALPSFPELCGPGEIADAVIAWRASDAVGTGLPEGAPPLSDEGIHRLIRFAYHASQLPDEGRYLRFRLVNSMRGELPRVTTFLPRAPIRSPNDLRRIAPVCDHAEHALAILEEGGTLWCDGIVHVGQLGVATAPGSPEVLRRSGTVPFVLDIKGPGFMAVRGRGQVGIEIRGGRAQVLSPVSLIPAFVEMLERFGEACVQRAIPDRNDEARRAFGGAAACMEAIASGLVRDALRQLVGAGHGGTIVIVPGHSQLMASPLSIPFRVTDLDFGRQIGEFFKTCVRCRHDADAIGDWESARARLVSGISALVGFTLVDGCVVLDEHLNTIGFGAEITVKDEAARLGMPFASYKRRETFAYDDFMRFIGGTRHRSAARLCATKPGAIAFVVSQDGELRVFCNDGMQAFGFGPMDTE